MARIGACPWLAAIAVVLAAGPASAQSVLRPGDGFQLSGTSRMRAEAISGQPRAGVNGEDMLLNLRSTLLAQYRTGGVTFAAELRDSRAWGADDGSPLSTNEVNALEPVQAFVRIEGGGATRYAVQLGRAMLNAGSRRLIAADDYRNTTNGYTGVTAEVAGPSGASLYGLYTLPQRRLPNDRDSVRSNRAELDQEGFDLQLFGGLASLQRKPSALLLETTVLRLMERDTPGRPTRNRSLSAVSFRVMKPPRAGAWDFEVEAIAQGGSLAVSLSPDAQRQSVSAGFLHVDIGYTFSGTWKPRLAIEYDHATGDKLGGRYTRFDTLFGMRRADLGPSGLYNAFGRANFIAPGLRLEAMPRKGTELLLTGKPLWLDSRTGAFSTTGVRDPRGRSGRYAGTQLDFRVRHAATPYLMLEMNGVGLFKGHFLREAPNANPDRRDTAYVSVNATRRF